MQEDSPLCTCGLEEWALDFVPPEAYDEVTGVLSKIKRQYEDFSFEVTDPGFVFGVRIFRGLRLIRDDGYLVCADRFVHTDPGSLLNGVFSAAESAHEVSWSKTESLLKSDSWSFEDSISAQMSAFRMVLSSVSRRLPSLKCIFSAKGDVFLPEAKAALEKALTVDMERSSKKAMSDFMSALNPEGMRCMDIVGVRSCRAYNWFMGAEGDGDPDSFDSERGKRRRQATLAYPVLHNYINNQFDPLRDVVDDAGKLAQAIGEKLSLPPFCVRLLNGLSPSQVGTFAPSGYVRNENRRRRMTMTMKALPFCEESNAAPGFDELRKFILFLPSLNGLKIPQSPDEWEGFLYVADLAMRLEGDSTKPSPGKTLSSAAASWKDVDTARVKNAVEEMGDVAGDFFEKVLSPYMETVAESGERWKSLSKSSRENKVAAIYRTMFHGRPLSDILNAVEWWHESHSQVLRRLSSKFPAERAGNDWPPLHEGSWKASNGCVPTPLCSQEDLDEEHERLGHCVDTYANSCVFYGTHILSIRNADGMSLSTVEIDQKDFFFALENKTDVRFAVVQHKGKKNVPPPSESVTALEEYLAAVVSGKLVIDFKFLSESLEKRRDKSFLRTKSYGGPGYEFKSEGALEEAWSAYSIILSKSASKKGPGEFLDSLNAEISNSAQREK